MKDHRWPTYTPRQITLDAAVDDGEGRGSLRVRDTGGKVYLDAVGGIGCQPLGHGHPVWIEAIEKQMRKLVTAPGTFWTEPQQVLASQVLERTPITDGRVFFGNTGTEVTEASLKLATRATGRDVVIAFERAFHGRSLGSIAMTANPKYREPYVTVADEDHKRFATMNVARAPYGDLEAVEALMNKYANRVAMVALEPVQGEGGVHPAARDFLVGLRQLCDRHQALLGIDEIQCGSGRTGRFTAWQALVGDDPELEPDIVWLAKALGGGYPIAACISKREFAEHMTKGSHGSTFGGNPLACAAANATLQIMDNEHLMESAGAQVGTLRSIAKRQPIPQVQEIRGLGAMIGLELGNAEVARSTVAGLQREGVLATMCGGTAIRWLFAYRVGESVLEEAWSALGRALKA